MYRRIEGSNIQTKIQMKIQPKFKLDRQWDYFTSLRTSAFYNSYSQKNIQYVALPKRCFFTSRNIFEIPLSWKTCSNHLGFFKKQRTVATGLDLSTTSLWLKTSHHITSSQGAERTTCKSCSGDTWNRRKLRFIGEASIPLAIMAPSRNLWTKAPAKDATMLNCQFSAGLSGL